MNRLSNNNRRDRKNNNDERLEIDKTEGMIKQVLEEIRREKTEEVEWKERFLMVKCRNFKNLSDYEEGKKVREAVRKIMEELNIFEIKLKNIRDLLIDAIEQDYNKLVGDLNMKKDLK